MDAIEYGYPFYHPPDEVCGKDDCFDCKNIDCEDNKFFDFEDDYE